MKISFAANTFVPAYLVLREKGFVVTKQDISMQEESWYARKKDLELIAEDTVALLGLASLHEHRGEAWQAADSELKDFRKEFSIEN